MPLQLHLDKIRSYFLKKIAVNKTPLFKNIDEPNSNASQQLLNGNLNGFNESNTNSIFIHPKYADVIGFLEELQELKDNSRDELLPEVAIRHGISLNESKCLYLRANELFNDDRLLLGRPKGSKNQEVIIRALNRAYQMSIKDPEKLRMFIEIFAHKQNLNNSSIHFGIKKNQLEMLQSFMLVGCQLIDASHWQVRAYSEQVVSDVKKDLSLNSSIRVGARESFHGYEVRVVQKKRRRSDNNLAMTDEYYSSSGVLKYLGCLLYVLAKVNDS